MSLLQRLHELQEMHGYLSEETLRELSRQEKVPLYRLQGLVSFYPHFRTAPPPRLDVAVCRDMSCWLAGGASMCRRLDGEADSVPGCRVREVSCLGRCDSAPAAAVNGVPTALTEKSHVSDWAGSSAAAPAPLSQPTRAWRCDPYAGSAEHYGVLRELLGEDRTGAATRVLAALKESGLHGMGGAGFSAASKWELVRAQQRTPKFVICNADESEPGTFKDRVILAQLPHLVIEGMILAGVVTGAERGILFIRHEYARNAWLSSAPCRKLGRGGWLGGGWAAAT
jgi:NADH:ubiquinone oxidoreductase subunit E